MVLDSTRGEILKSVTQFNYFLPSPVISRRCWDKYEI